MTELRYTVEDAHGDRNGVELVPDYSPTDLPADARERHERYFKRWGTEDGALFFEMPIASYFEVGETIDEKEAGERFKSAIEDVRQAVEGLKEALVPAVESVAPALRGIGEAYSDAMENADPGAVDAEGDGAMDDAIGRFWMDGVGERCPDCSSEDVETVTVDGHVALAHCPDCEFVFESEESAALRYDELPDAFQRIYDACVRHDTWTQLCPKCVERRERSEQRYW